MLATFDGLRKPLIGADDIASGGGNDVVDNGSPGIDLSGVVEYR